MKKIFRIIIPFALLLALIISIKPVQSSVDVNVKNGIAVCSDDNEDGLDLNVIRNE